MSTRRTRTVAGALAVLLGALGVVAGTATTAQAAPAQVSGGHLDWGVKQSFRNYIRGPIAHGTITTSDGATGNADGTFRFPSAQGSVDDAANTADLAFAGKVEFAGHDSGSGPQLYLTITQIRVTLDGAGGGTLVADVVSKSLQSGQLVTYDDVPFADLDASGSDLVDTGGTVTATGIAATLTEDGVPAFASFYPAGTPLDPLTFSVTTVPPPVWQPAVAASKTTGLDPDGETITVTGTGFDPAANIGTRPPLAGKPTGIYVVFAKITQPWRPSEGAPASARTVLDQKWVLPPASRAVVDPAGTNPDLADLTAEGAFATTLDVARITPGTADCATDTCGVIVYAAGGAVNAAHEFFLPLTFTPTQTTTTTTAPPPPSTVVGDARLEWGFKQSFRTYIRGPIAHGSWALTGVTDNNGAGPFRWDDLASGDFDPDGPDGLLTFTGSVRFTGHDSGAGPLLDLTISQPQIRFVDGAATLLLDIRSKGLDSGEFVELDDAEFATLDLATVTPSVVNGVRTYAGVPAALTEQGAQGFAGFYPAGTQLDPVTISIAGPGATLPPATGSAGTTAKAQGGIVPAALAHTGTRPWPLTLAGAALLVLGTALLLTRRRARR